MPNYICATCGVQHAESDAPPSECPICLDPRQYVGWGGQRWTTMDDLIRDGYRNDLRPEEPNLLGIGITPSFTIGQRALLVQTPNGNVLYDCVSLLDDDAIAEIERRGGIACICFSHPHFYDSMVEYSRAFDAPIIIPEADREHVMRPDPAIEYWDGNPLELLPGATLIQCGGHFDGSAVLHWRDGADGKGALLVGDSITVVPRPPLRQLHDQLPEPDTYVPIQDTPHPVIRRAIRIRPHLRRLVGPQRNDRRERRRNPLG